MAPRYFINRDVGGPDGASSISPYWVLGFARYAKPVTYDPTKVGVKRSLSENPGDAVAERSVLVVGGDCVQAAVTASKTSHVSNLQAVLMDGANKYLTEILPGDWVVMCVAYSVDEAKVIAQKMSQGQAINGWNDGLKFVGRVVGIRKQVIYERATGKPNSKYALTATGFDQFDTMVMYYPQLVNAANGLTSMLQFGLAMDSIIRGTDSVVSPGGGIDINKMIPRLAQVIFGQGAWQSAPSANGVQASPNQPYLIPATVAKWLGVSSAIPTFADILRIMTGIQHFRSTAPANNFTTSNFWTLFTPDELRLEQGVLRCPSKLVGTFPIESLPTGQTTVWNLFSNFMNSPLNEMYVALKADKDTGRVFPFLTIRQTPYSTNQAYSQVNSQSGLQVFDIRDFNAPGGKGKLIDSRGSPEDQYLIKLGHKLDTTEMLELPRWVVTEDVLYDADIGRSDALRANLVFVTGSGSGVVMDPIQNFVRAPPVQDQLDILRSGIRPYQVGVNCFLRDLQLGPQKWRDLLADIAMGQHLTLNGQFTVVGIRAPVAPGDNLEFEGTVYHIEQVTHTFTLDPSSGNRVFQTTMLVTRGINDLAIRQSTERASEYPLEGAISPAVPTTEDANE